uniref:Zgc:92429 n=1 Tax=Nothobranchius furzeri TaxID=105023 RepID=A0A8C6L5K0_NOTFU
MALLCYNKGCGETFDPSKNKDDSCLFHPGVPIFHDALKGWSCCKKRTTDFSEFLSIKGCSRGRHSNVKPQEPLRPEVLSDKADVKHTNNQEIIYQGPKSAEALKRERPSSEEPMTKLPYKVSASLVQALEKLGINQRTELLITDLTVYLTSPRLIQIYQGPDTDLEACTHHPGAPVFHEGYKYWSCCCIKTTDFDAFLDQKGCTTAKHRWIPKQDKKKVACRYDWHQTGNSVVLTIYAKNSNPDSCSIEANQTVVSCQIQFESNKIFRRNFHLWGVINVKQSSVNMVPTKVEITLRKADQVAWGKLEDPNYKPEPEPVEEDFLEIPESYQPDWDINDDDISDSDEEEAPEVTQQKITEQITEGLMKKQQEMQNSKRKEVEEEMKRVMEEKMRAEEEKRKIQEQRKQEDQEGYEDMPDLEDGEADVE